MNDAFVSLVMAIAILRRMLGGWPASALTRRWQANIALYWQIVIMIGLSRSVEVIHASPQDPFSYLLHERRLFWVLTFALSLFARSIIQYYFLLSYLHNPYFPYRRAPSKSPRLQIPIPSFVPLSTLFLGPGG